MTVSKPETVIGDAETAGIKYSTLRRAADELGVHKKRETFSNKWIWSLSEENVNSSPTAETNTSTFTEFDAFA